MQDPFGQTHPESWQSDEENPVAFPSFDEAFSTLIGIDDPEPTPIVEDTREYQDNDSVRYQYWQSQADKLKNELEDLKRTVYENSAQREVIEEEQKFPDPPSAPRKPAGFSYEEAMSDARSESARYLSEKEEYDRNINDFNSLRVEYELAQLRKAKETFAEEQRMLSEQAEMEYQREMQMKQAAQTAMQRYGADPATAIRFVREMSSPESITMDNLWALYNMRSNGRVPSQQFRQTQRAQQVAPPMGVVPGGRQEPLGRSVDDIIMDSLVDDYKKRNPWG